MRILVLADIDEQHWQAGGGRADLLLSCGDLFDQVIVEAAQAYHCPKIFAVKGNHDQDRSFASPIEDLHLRVCNYGGLRFGGLNGAWRSSREGFTPPAGILPARLAARKTAPCHPAEPCKA